MTRPEYNGFAKNKIQTSIESSSAVTRTNVNKF